MSKVVRLTFFVLTLPIFLTTLFLLEAGLATAQSGCSPSITVTSSGDSGPGTLRQSLADVCSGGTVNFAAGLANQTITLTSAELSITKTVTITNPNAANLKVSGNNARRVFNIQAGAMVTINNLSIISGTVTGWECSDGCGGGILVNREAILTITNSIFRGNLSGGPIVSSKGGGGIYNEGILTVNNCSLSENQATGDGGGIYSTRNGILNVNSSTFSSNLARDGGAIFTYGGSINGSTILNNSPDNCDGIVCGGGGIYNYGSILTLTNSSLFNNHSEFYGGGIYNEGTLMLTNAMLDSNSARLLGGGIYNEGTLIATNSTFISNSTADSGGGIFNMDPNNSNSTLTNNTFSSNSALYGSGIANYSPLTINNNIFIENLATGLGGGILSYGVLTVTNSTFSGNSAASYGGGGIDNRGTLTVTNSTFSGNSATTHGGGIHNYGYIKLTVDNSTFNGNSAGISGGNIYNGDYSTLHLRNSILANSSWGGDCFYISTSTIGTNLNNLIEDGSCNSALSGDPNLGPLVNNGGSTLTHALLPGSPAINAGDNASCLATDQRGIARPQQGQCDIGAFESRGFILTRSSGNNQTTPIGSPFSTPLIVTVASNAAGEPVNGGIITFTGPGSGASTNPVSTSVTISGSTASASVMANTIVGGPYNVAASAKGGNLVNFSLTNTKATPSVTVASSLNPSVFGQVVTFTATVSYHVGTPTGSVAFVIDGTPQSPVTLVGGQATFFTSSLAAGNHTISANYSGDTNFNASSGSLAGGQTVNPADAPTTQFTHAIYTTNEGDGTSQSVVLTRSGTLTSTSQVQVNLNGGSASAGIDYSSISFPLTLTFGSGVVSQTVPIGLVDDILTEPTETISLTVTSLSNAIIGAQSNAVLQIVDNDAGSPPPEEIYLPLIVK